MKHHKPRLTKRKNRHGEAGYWYYRKRIPTDVLDVWHSGRKLTKEYVVSLETRNEREANKRAVQVHEAFLAMLDLKRQEKRTLKSENQIRIDSHLRYEAYLKRMGAHPEQAPRAFDKEAVRKYYEAVDAVKYGKLACDEIAIPQDPTFDDQGNLVQQEPAVERVTQFTGGLSDYMSEFDPDSDQYHEIIQDIEFLEGKRSRDYAYRPEVPTLQNALNAYRAAIKEKPKPEAKKASEVKRIERLVKDFAFLIAGGDVKDGLSRSLETIRVADGDRFVVYLRRSKSYSSVEREISIMAAMWNVAVEEFKDTWPVYQRNDNPFSGRGKKLLELHDQEVLQGKVQNKNRRAFRKNELDLFMMERLPRMRDDLQLISMLALHVGCRLEDITGLVLNDCHLKVSQNRPIPYIHVRHNRLRSVTKDGIERHIPLFGEVYERLLIFTNGRTGKDEPLFPAYGREDGSGAGAASATINKHIKAIRGDDVRLTFHSFRHTVQAKALAAKVDNKWAAYMGGWRNADSLGLQKAYQKDGVPLALLKENIECIHSVSDWGHDVEYDTDEWDAN